MESTERLAAWGAWVTAFNRGETAALKAIIDPTCTLYAGDKCVASSADEIVAVMDAGRAAGWTQHNLISVAGSGPFLTSLYENVYADGSRQVGCGVAICGADGTIATIRSFVSTDFPATS